MTVTVFAMDWLLSIVSWRRTLLLDNISSPTEGVEASIYIHKTINVPCVDDCVTGKLTGLFSLLLASSESFESLSCLICVFSSSVGDSRVGDVVSRFAY